MKNSEPAFNIHPTTRILNNVLLEPPFVVHPGCKLQGFIQLSCAGNILTRHTHRALLLDR